MWFTVILFLHHYISSHIKSGQAGSIWWASAGSQVGDTQRVMHNVAERRGRRSIGEEGRSGRDEKGGKGKGRAELGRRRRGRSYLNGEIKTEKEDNLNMG